MKNINNNNSNNISHITDVYKNQTNNNISNKRQEPQEFNIDIYNNYNNKKETNSYEELEKYNIFVDQDLEITSCGHYENDSIYEIGEIIIDIFNDGRIELGCMNVTNAKRINIDKDGIHIETDNGTWTITNDEKTIFKTKDDKTYKYDFDIRLKTNPGSITDDYIIDINNYKIDGNGNIVYSDDKTKIELIYDNQGRTLSFNQNNVTIEYNYNPTEEDRKALKNMNGDIYADDNMPINYVATAKIRGYETKYYSVGDQEETNTTYYPIAASLAYSKYSDRILSILESDFYAGTVIGPWELSEKTEDNNNVAAYTNNNWTDKEKFHIFIPYEECQYLDNWYKYNIPLHEMTHIIDNYYCWYQCEHIDENNIKNTYYNDIQNLYEKYKEIAPTLPYSVYNINTGFDNSPNYWEFIADIATNYYINPKALKRYYPELYEFVDRMFGEEEYYTEPNL